MMNVFVGVSVIWILYKSAMKKSLSSAQNTNSLPGELHPARDYMRSNDSLARICLVYEWDIVRILLRYCIVQKFKVWWTRNYS